MYIVYGQVEIFLPACSSLKEKRATLQSIIARIRKRFNISVCEADYHDLWQRSIIGFSAVCSHYSETDLIIDIVQDTVYQHDDVCELISFDHQLFQFQLGDKHILDFNNPFQ
ncbi:MAG: DUF503 domain-containing protein [Bacillota bacterium]|nr:DUF503 domain-containing protein [Bacillota bacterium]